MTQSKPETIQGTDRPAHTTPLQRAGRIGLDFLNPLSDLKVLAKGVKPTLGRLSDLREGLRHRPTAKPSLTWAQAVEGSGQSAEQLAQGYRRRRHLPWFAMMVSAGLSLSLVVMLVTTESALPEAVLNRALSTVFMLLTICAVCFTKVLKTNFRLWQLINRRVSVDELGTFTHYRAENSMWLQLVTFKV